MHISLVFLCPNFPSYKGTIHIRLGLTLIASFPLNNLCKGPNSKCSHILWTSTFCRGRRHGSQHSIHSPVFRMCLYSQLCLLCQEQICSSHSPESNSSVFYSVLEKDLDVSSQYYFNFLCTLINSSFINPSCISTFKVMIATNFCILWLLYDI